MELDGSHQPAARLRFLILGANRLTRRRVLGNHVPGVLIHALDEVLKHRPLHAPLSPATDLDRWKLPGSNQGVSLRARHVEDVSNVGEREKPSCHRPIVANPGTGFPTTRDLWISRQRPLAVDNES